MPHEPPIQGTAAAADPCPLVSFVVTVFNGAPYLEDCIAWLLRTDWPAFEIVILNDGSTDQTAAIARRLAASDNRIRVLDEGRLGRARALNRAIECAAGDIIAIQDVDDYALPGRLNATVPLLMADPSLSLAAGRVERIESRDGTEQRLTSLRQEPLNKNREVFPIDFYMGKSPVMHSTLVFRKSTWQQIGGYRTDTSIEDLEFCYDLLARGRGVVTSSIVELIYINPNSAMRSLHSNYRYLTDLLKANDRARKMFSFSGFNAIYRIMPYYLFAVSVLFHWRHRIAKALSIGT